MSNFPRIIWANEKAKSKENKHAYEDMIQKIQRRFDYHSDSNTKKYYEDKFLLIDSGGNYEDTVTYQDRCLEQLTGSKENMEACVVIVGSTGEPLVKKLNTNKSVVAILCFCGQASVK